MMEKRACKRIQVDLAVKFHCGNKVHNGTVINISEKGMFIKTDEMCFPFESQLEVVIPFDGGNLQIPVSLRRMEMSPDSHDCIGVEFLGRSEKYFKFVDSLRAGV